MNRRHTERFVAGESGRAGGHCHRPRECAGWQRDGQEGRASGFDGGRLHAVKLHYRGTAEALPKNSDRLPDLAGGGHQTYEGPHINIQAVEDATNTDGAGTHIAGAAFLRVPVQNSTCVLEKSDFRKQTRGAVEVVKDLVEVGLAYTEALSLFGTEKEMHAAMEQSFLLFKSNCGEASDNAADA
jgi:hypothetical protein